MAAAERDVSAKPVTAESTLDLLNRELVPVVRAMRTVINRELRAESTTVGDGIASVFTVTHALGTTDVFVQLKDALTFEVYDRSDGYAVMVLDDATVQVTAPAPEPVDGLRVSIRV